MAWEDPSIRPRPDAPAARLARRTAEMPQVDLLDLLRLDRELAAAPIAIPASADLTSPMVRTAAAYEITERVRRPPSTLRLVILFLVALGVGFSLTSPLW